MVTGRGPELPSAGEAGAGLQDRWGPATCMPQVLGEVECAFSHLKPLGIGIARPPSILISRRGPGGGADGIWDLVGKHHRAVPECWAPALWPVKHPGQGINAVRSSLLPA